MVTVPLASFFDVRYPLLVNRKMISVLVLFLQSSINDLRKVTND